MYIYVAVVVVLVLLVLQNSRAVTRADDVPRDAPPQVSDVMVVGTECRGYAPVGTLSDDQGKVLQLYSKPCGYNRGRYNYYTMVDDNRIPVELQFNGRRCENGIGCDQVYSGDTMTASEFGTRQPLKVQLYRD